VNNYLPNASLHALPADDRLRHALSRGHRIDITTTGRRTGLPRRIELVFHNIGGRIYISGMPSRRKRAWIHNLEADPRMTFHLKSVGADLPAHARVIGEPAERREILAGVARAWNRDDVDVMVAASPLIEVLFDETESETASAAAAGNTPA
jgi:deazaflavin-dependent oxidoreductase (nitroreductase family)